jgi:hypothetical protein
MRSGLAREIFQQDLIQIYSEQTMRRNTLTRRSHDALKDILAQIQSGVCENTVIEELLSRLAQRLRPTTGKKQYGYLKAPLKELVNQIVDELAKDARVAEAYAKWYELRNEVLRTYKDELPDPLPLSQQKEFKSIKNMVIAEAMNIGGHHFTFVGDEAADILNEETVSSAEESDSEMPEEDRLPVMDEAPRMVRIYRLLLWRVHFVPISMRRIPGNPITISRGATAIRKPARFSTAAMTWSRTLGGSFNCLRRNRSRQRSRHARPRPDICGRAWR